ncbi:MAG: prepilin-type N-terminal cleavage/methylation domain-containing protein [Planctomycetota bacterium]
MRTRAFTLIEILVVVVIIGLIATLVGPHIFTIDTEARRKIALAKCVEYHNAVRMWRIVHKRGAYPATLTDMEVPLHEGETDFARIDLDPWGGEYRLEFQGPNVHVCCDGPDQTADTDDDICYVARDG